MFEILCNGGHDSEYAYKNICIDGHEGLTRTMELQFDYSQSREC